MIRRLNLFGIINYQHKDTRCDSRSFFYVTIIVTHIWCLKCSTNLKKFYIKLISFKINQNSGNCVAFINLLEPELFF